MNAIIINDLSKIYGKVTALKNIVLEIPEGKIFGLIGPNGSGKTTLIKTLAGVIRPTSGSTRVLGLDPIVDKWILRKQIGYMPQSPALYDDISARENITFFGRAQPNKNLKEKVEKVLSFAELTSRADDAVGNLSGGMKKRVSLCCALINDPKILFLDEPTAAVDSRLKMQSWALFRKLAATGVTIIISTHLMDEALLCDNVMILREGEIVALDSPQNILLKGKTRLKIKSGNNESTSTIDSTPENLANELKKAGLSQDITSVELLPDNIEDIILSLVDLKEKEL